MGWWSMAVMGGDTPLDYELDVLGYSGLSRREIDSIQEAQPSPKMLAKIQDKFLKNFDKLSEWCDERDDPIASQVLAVQMMRYGVPISPGLRKRLIKDGYVDDSSDGWSDPAARKRALASWKSDVEKYVDGTPTELTEADEGLFAALDKSLSDGIINTK